MHLRSRQAACNAVLVILELLLGLFVDVDMLGVGPLMETKTRTREMQSFEVFGDDVTCSLRPGPDWCAQ